jgi:inhibitor of KinA sporulation pathway (predicted exonuclease)
LEEIVLVLHDKLKSELKEFISPRNYEEVLAFDFEVIMEDQLNQEDEWKKEEVKNINIIHRCESQILQAIHAYHRPKKSLQLINKRNSISFLNTD